MLMRVLFAVANLLVETGIIGILCTKEYDYYRQDCRVTANCRDCFYSQAKNQVFRPAGATRCTDSGQTLQDTWVRLIVQNFTPIRAERWECGPKKYKKYPLFGKESPRRGDSIDRFRKFLEAFIRLTIYVSVSNFM